VALATLIVLYTPVSFVSACKLQVQPGKVCMQPRLPQHASYWVTYLSGGSKFSKFVAHHLLSNLQACHALAAVVHEEHTPQKVWQDDTGSALCFDNSGCWSTLESSFAPPLWVLPCHCYDIFE
jgi:hypothetical protein